MEDIDYLSARIFALASQLHFFRGKTHPYYEYAYREFYYFVNEVASCPAYHIGVKIARSIRRRMNEYTETEKSVKNFVCLISEKQAFRMAQVAIEKQIELKSAIELTWEGKV